MLHFPFVRTVNQESAFDGCPAVAGWRDGRRVLVKTFSDRFHCYRISTRALAKSGLRAYLGNRGTAVRYSRDGQEVGPQSLIRGLSEESIMPGQVRGVSLAESALNLNASSRDLGMSGRVQVGGVPEEDAGSVRDNPVDGRPLAGIEATVRSSEAASGGFVIPVRSPGTDRSLSPVCGNPGHCIRPFRSTDGDVCIWFSPWALRISYNPARRAINDERHD
jgi:hypothetical protein